MAAIIAIIETLCLCYHLFLHLLKSTSFPFQSILVDMSIFSTSFFLFLSFSFSFSLFLFLFSIFSLFISRWISVSDFSHIFFFFRVIIRSTATTSSSFILILILIAIQSSSWIELQFIWILWFTLWCNKKWITMWFYSQSFFQSGEFSGEIPKFWGEIWRKIPKFFKFQKSFFIIIFFRKFIILIILIFFIILRSLLSFGDGKRWKE